MMESLQFLGRFHPVVLHFPIGFLLLAYLLEIGIRFFGREEFRQSIAFILKLSLVASCLTAGSGYLLAQEGGYEATLLWQHQYLGFSVLIGNLILLLIYPKPERPLQAWYFPVFTLLSVLLLLAGHKGGSLTHGSQFLSDGWSKNTDPATIYTPLDSNDVFYTGVVEKIFAERCMACHNAQKEKGGLRLDQQDLVLRGGDSGSLFSKDQLLSERLNLALDHKEHMPPKGKPQLSKAEKELILSWLAQGASFDKNIASLSQKEPTRKALASWDKVRQEKALGQGPPPIAPAVLEKLVQKGIDIRNIAQGSPYLEAQYIYRDTLTLQPITELKVVKNNLVSLKLHNSAISNQDLKGISRLTQLQKIDLHATSISDEALHNFKSLKNLQYLNLYQTNISDQGLNYLKENHQLQSLYLWQSKVTLAAAQALEKAIPGLVCNLGRTEMVFGKSKIKPPVIRSREYLFSDTISISLFSPLPNTTLLYSIDGSTPDHLYSAPFTLTKSAMVKVICQKEGWEDSDLVEKEFLETGYPIDTILLSNLPAEKYFAQGATSLYDLRSGSDDFSSQRWLGYNGEHLNLVVDLGKIQRVQQIAIGSLVNTNAWIFPMRGMECATSKDGQNYSEKAVLHIAEATAEHPVISHYFKLDFPEREARFLKIKIKGQLKNPKWHPAPGESNWLFLDEVMVW